MQQMAADFSAIHTWEYILVVGNEVALCVLGFSHIRQYSAKHGVILETEVLKQLKKFRLLFTRCGRFNSTTHNSKWQKLITHMHN